ncbi:hypothetical protein SESBI_26548 [Sesbania bispinosa]|nr:hypothetical protein SESBI_26548 [Sesbania bispinosa]
MTEDGGVPAGTPMLKSERIRAAFQQARMKSVPEMEAPPCIYRSILAGKSVRQLQ